MLVRRGIPRPVTATIALGFVALATPAGAQPAAAPAASSPPPASAAPAQPGSAAPAQPAPPPGYGYPPPGYPPPGYPPPGYGYPPPGYAYPGYPPKKPPPTLPYREGQEIPSGYHLEEHARRGLVIGGAIMTGVPYVIGLSLASGDGFVNRSGWLILPVVGPWVALGERPRCDQNRDDGLACLGEFFVRMFLVMDGMIQTGGAIMFSVGLAATKRQLVRDDQARFLVLPTRVGSGYGVGAFARF